MPPIKKSKPFARGITFLREWRDYRDLTLEAASERLDIHHTTLLRIEKGQSPYNQDFLERCALAYGCDVEDLLFNNPYKPKGIPHLVFDALKNASPGKQAEALRIVEALLRAG